MDVRDTRVDPQDVIIVWSKPLGIQGYTKGIGRTEEINGIPSYSFARLPSPVSVESFAASDPEYAKAFNTQDGNEYQYIPSNIADALMEHILSGGKFSGNRGEKSSTTTTRTITLDTSKLSRNDVLAGIDLRKPPKKILKLLQSCPVQPTIGARSVLIATAILASEYERVPGEFSTIQLLLGLVESAKGGPDYHLTQSERDALTALAEVITPRQAYRLARNSMTAHPHTPPLLAEASQLEIDVTSGAETIIFKAAATAQSQGHDTFGADHLVRAFLDSPGVSIQLPKWLKRIDLTEQDLAEHWLQAMERARHDRPATGCPLSDHVDGTGEDLLDIDGDARTLARFIANRKTTPPMAIALFGEWGQGKSFFSKRVQAHVKILSSPSQDQLAGKSDSDDLPYHAHICQVEFNAWHYMESNLWASMVDHIVTSLDEHMNGKKDEKKELLKELSQWNDDLSSAKKEFEDAEEAAKKATDEVTELDAEINTRESERSEVTFDWDTLWSEAHGILTKDDKFSQSIDSACKELGLPEIGNDANKLRNVYVQVNGTIAIWRPLIKRVWPLLKAHLWKAGLGVAFIAGLIGAFLWIFPVSDWRAWLGLMGAVPIIATAASLWLGRLRNLGKLLTNAFEQVEALTRHKENEAELTLTRIRQQQRVALSRLDAAHKQAASCRAALAEAQRKLAALAPDAQLRDFFARRMSDQTYSKHLGLIATIRRDFERMSQLLAERSDKDSSPLPSLRRVVLYVDDLDRCPPKLVLQVLQAIHLLLAFRLFVVVVAVDVRWLVRTLQKEHPFLADAMKHEEELHDHATAEDYLEKIFQIPYWVRPMGDNAASTYVRALLKASEAPQDHSEGMRQGQTDAPPKGDAGKENDDAEIPSEPAEEQKSKADDSLAPITYSVEELEMADRLSRHLGGSPRRTKRFVNLYLLVKLGLSNRQRTSLVANNDHTCIMILLALVIAMPRHAAKVLDTLSQAAEKSTLDASCLHEWKGDEKERLHGKAIPSVAEEHGISIGKIKQWLPLARRHLFSFTPPPSSPATT